MKFSLKYLSFSILLISIGCVNNRKEVNLKTSQKIQQPVRSRNDEQFPMRLYFYEFQARKLICMRSAEHHARSR